MRKAALSLLTAAAITMIAAPVAQAEIQWQSNLRAAHAQAQAEGKLLLLHFYSDNCPWCDRLEEGSFRAPQVGEAVAKHYIPVKIHADRNPKLTEMFKVTKFPTDVIVTTKGKTLSHSVSPQLPDRYAAMLTSVVPNAAATDEKLAIDTVTQPKPESGSQTAVATNPSATVGVPDYAKAPLPTGSQPSAANIASSAPTLPTGNTPPTEATSEPSGGFVLPGSVPGQLAGSRNEGLSLQMPSPVASSAPTPNTAASIPALDTPAISHSPDPAKAAATAKPSRPTASRPAAAEMPELAMQGFCAVTVINDDRWAEGSPQYGVIHLGKLYLFVSEEAMQTFLADPTPYTPVLNEIDVVRFFEEKKIVPGKREWGVKDPIYNRMFFFADEAARNHFEKSYERYTDAAIEVMEKAVKDANPGT